MNRRSRHFGAFSLVEVTLALGVAAFCLIAVFGMLPVGVQTNRNATSQTAAASMIANVIADLRATPKTPGTWTGTSSQFGIPLGTSTTLYFDNAGQFTTSLDANSLYQLNITFPSAGSLTYADLKVTWPAAASAANISGSSEMFAAFDRN